MYQVGVMDDLDSSHGYLHRIAASVATAASKELLQDIRAAVGDSKFLRYSRNSIKQDLSNGLNKIHT